MVSVIFLPSGNGPLCPISEAESQQAYAFAASGTQVRNSTPLAPLWRYINISAWTAFNALTNNLW